MKQENECCENCDGVSTLNYKCLDKNCPCHQPKEDKKCCGNCREYNSGGGNKCERWLICDDNCTCKAPHPLHEEILEEFDRKWRFADFQNKEIYIFTKSFLSQALTRTRQAAIEECLGVLPERLHEVAFDSERLVRKMGFNQALSQIRERIKKLQ